MDIFIKTTRSIKSEHICSSGPRLCAKNHRQQCFGEVPMPSIRRHRCSSTAKIHFGAHGHKPQYLMRLENCFSMNGMDQTGSDTCRASRQDGRHQHILTIPCM